MFLAFISRQLGSTRPEPISPLHPNAPEPLLEIGQTTLFHGEPMNPAWGFDQDSRRQQAKHFALPWLPPGPGRILMLHCHSQKECNGKTLLPSPPILCRGREVQPVHLCNTPSSNHDSSHNPNLRSCNWKEVIPRYFAEVAPECQDDCYVEENGERFRARSN